MYSMTTVLQTAINLVKLATDKTLDFYYTVITSDLYQRIFPFCGYQCTSQALTVASFTKLTVKRLMSRHTIGKLSLMLIIMIEGGASAR